jgi:hypothetical protein
VKLTQLVAVFFCLAIAQSFAGSRSGVLVDCNCYDTLGRNVNPFETSPAARDWNRQIQYCSPNTKTKTFGVVLEDFTRLKFDSSGNAKAAELVRKAGKKSRFLVTVNGEMNGKIIKVKSISLR